MSLAPARLRFPDFLCIGAQKAGTTWLYANLARHPDLWLPPVKELHYFDQLHEVGNRQRDVARWRRRAEQDLARHRLPGDDEVVAAVAGLFAAPTLTDDWYGSLFAAP